MYTVEVSIPKIEPQIARLEAFPQIAGEQLGQAMRQALAVGASDIREIAPVDSGRLRAGTNYEVRSVAGADVVGVIGNNVNHNGFSYPAALDASERYHYRRGPRAGSQTKGYFSDLFKRKGKAIEALFAKAVAQIVERLKS